MIYKTIALQAMLLTLATGCGKKTGGGGTSDTAAPSAQQPAPSEPEKATPPQPSPEAQKATPFSSMLVETVAGLPACDASKKGALAYAKKEGSFQTCDGSAWAEIDVRPKGLEIKKNALMKASSENFCTQFSSIESCFFGGGQVLSFNDGTMVVTGIFNYLAHYDGGSDTDTDSDQSSITMIVAPTATGMWQRLSSQVARGNGFSGMYLLYTRQPEAFKLIFDSDDDLVIEDSDEVVLNIEIEDQ